MTDKEKKLEQGLRDSFAKIKKLRTKVSRLKNLQDEPIAIIGMGCRLPGNVNSPEEFWEFLIENKDGIIEIPAKRWDVDAYYDPDKEAPGKMYVRKGGFLQTPVDEFDADFFHISPREAEDMDPQQRLALEVAYQALQNAGLKPNDLMHTATGVYMGICFNDYGHLITESGHLEAVDHYYSTGNHYSVLSGRISYFFGFEGPSISLDTACSSSLVAIDAAVKDLRLKRTNLALAGGVNLMLAPEPTINFCKSGMLSPEGHCKTFDASADGYVRGEGCGIIVLKRLSDAIADKNIILGIIRGTAVNQDGASSGLTVPNGLAQEQVIQSALENAKISAPEVTYVEAHGTGTSLGDPIELEALKNIYTKERPNETPIFVGSVKTNIGHTEAAAGVASVIKVVLSLLHEKIPATLYFKKLNPKVNLSNVPLEIASQNIDWKRGVKRLAGVSSFGFSGTNAHVIIEEGPQLADYEWAEIQKRSQEAQIFHRQRYWADAAMPSIGKSIDFVHPLLGEIEPKPNGEIHFKGQLYLYALPYLNDHQVYGYTIYPGAGFMEMFLAAGLNGIGDGVIQASNISIEAALSFSSAKAIGTQTLMTPVDSGYEVAIYTQAADSSWICHAKGNVNVKDLLEDPARADIEALKLRCPSLLTKDEFYHKVNATGFYYGNQFQTLQTIYVGKAEALGELKLPTSSKGYLAHPAILDGALQLLLVSIIQEKSKDLYLPVGCDSFEFYAPLGDEILVHWQETEKTEMGRSGNLTFCTASGQILAKLTGMHYRKTTEQALKRMLAHESRVEDWLYEWTWEEKTLEPATVPDKLGYWLILSDGEVSESLGNLFESKGATTRQISADNHPKTKEAFVELLQSENFSGILHVSSTSDEALLSADTISSAQKLSTKSMLHLTQALIQLEDSVKIPLFLITKNLLKNGSKSEFSESAVLHGPLLGLFKTILMERPELSLRLIDVDNELDIDLVFEAIFSSLHEALFSLKKRQCYVPRFLKAKHISLEVDKSVSEEKIRSNGTYLITGGLGGLGLTLAKWLIEHGAGKIVLSGRRKLDDEIKSILNNLATEHTSITYESIDIAEEKSVAELLGRLGNQEKPLKGIFHLAGVLDDATLLKQDWNHFETVFRPKVYGSYYLHKYSKELDLFVMFSSIVSTLGNPGQSNYAAANAFMDALCEYRKEHGLSANSLSWGPWEEVGMAKSLVSRHAKVGLLGLNPKEAIRALEAALFFPQAHLTIAKIHWKNYFSQLVEPLSWFESFAEKVIKRGNLSGKLETIPASERFDAVKDYVVDVVRAVLGTPSSQFIDENKSFFEMGMDSLMAIELKNRLQSDIGSGLVLPTTTVFDYPNVVSMQEMLLKKMSEIKGIPSKEASSANVEKVSKNSLAHFELSPAQKRMWFLYEFNRGSTDYNLFMSYHLKGLINHEIFQKALDETVTRHAILRTTYAYFNDDIKQVIHLDCSVPLKEEDWSAFLEGDYKQKLLFMYEHPKPFDLEQEFPIRMTLIWISKPTEAILYFEQPHIASDDRSMRIILDDLFFYYEKFLNQSDAQLPKMPLEYVDYANWLFMEQKKPEYQSLLKYWENQLQEAPREIHLPLDYPRNADLPFEPAVIFFHIDHEIKKGVDNFSRKYGATPFVILNTVFALLLSRYSNDEELNIGIPIGNRPMVEMEKVAGLFVNTLVLRHVFKRDQSFSDLIKVAAKMVRDAFANAAAPFEVVVDILKLERNPAFHHLFQVFFNLLKAVSELKNLTHLTVEPLEISAGTPEFDLDLLILEAEEDYQARLTYNAKIFKEETIKSLIDHFIQLFKVVLESPDRPLREYEILLPEEKKKILLEWNNTATASPSSESLLQIFETYAKQMPEKIAVIYEGQNMSYGELNEKANQLAHYLINEQVKPGDPVALCLHRSFELIISILGILKTGAFYVPLDFNYPKERLEYFLENSQPKALIATRSILKSLDWLSHSNLIMLDDCKDKLANSSKENPGIYVHSSSVMYLIYTSGTTGKPKGVLGTYAGLLNRLDWGFRQFPYSLNERCCQKTSVNFVDHVAEIFSPLLKGIPLVILPQGSGDSFDLENFASALFENEITRIVLVPSLLGALVQMAPEKIEYLKCLKYIFCSGEKLPLGLVKKTFKLLPNVKIVNLYGSSEVSADVTSYELKGTDVDMVNEEEQTSALIGKPISNNKIYIVDKNTHTQLVPVGVYGEICVSGIGLAKGYLNFPELTAERFILNPFSDVEGEKMYCMGDLARYLPDGNIQYLGRLDHQVKIRGFRIELGEIESDLLEHPAIQEAVVVVREDEPGNPRLVAYYVVKHESIVEANVLHAHLKALLPDYMVPSFFIKLEEIPLNPNGKLDRKALPSPQGGEIRQHYVAPRTPTEEALTEIWQEVLHLDQVGIYDNFFDLGGHSLLAIQLFASVNKELGVNIPIAELFAAPTIAELAVRIDNQTRSAQRCLVPLNQSGSQRPLFCIHPIGGNVMCYIHLAHAFEGVRRCYGLQSLGLLPGQGAQSTIPEMAATYIQEIKTVQPEGPYDLLGWSFGGAVAFEVAHQLMQRGDLVGNLILIDSFVPSRVKQYLEEQNILSNKQGELELELEKLSLFAEDMARIAGKEIKEELATIQKAKTVLEGEKYLFGILLQHQILADNISLSDVRVLYKVFSENMMALVNYMPPSIEVDMLLIVASVKGPLGGQHAWKESNTGKVLIHEMTGDHYSLLQRENLNLLFDEIRALKK